ncbi:hypothetical protein NLG97_g5855 [Lecanicillium saksenae]|uniref:Uncharacterized protein n=1 Tax=Lecanicillium saksenae TaxID=468837 RepID=A0ACC1QR91_9HYPO|nr:hypothetical protein NLG97_g5855 [Lecanicillium saksenae]
MRHLFAVTTLFGYAIADSCFDKCHQAYDECRAASDANQSFCAAQIDGCLGYDWSSSGTNKPSVCANSTENIMWTTEVVTAYTTYCPGPTAVIINNKTHIVTEATTLTVTACPCTVTKPIWKLNDAAQPTNAPQTSKVPQPSHGLRPGSSAERECAEKCYDQYINCRGAPSSNESFCVAQIDGCLGYNWSGSGAGKPTECKKPTTRPNSPSGGTNQPPVVTSAGADIARLNICIVLIALAMMYTLD